MNESQNALNRVHLYQLHRAVQKHHWLSLLYDWLGLLSTVQHHREVLYCLSPAQKKWKFKICSMVSTESILHLQDLNTEKNPTSKPRKSGRLYTSLSVLQIRQQFNRWQRLGELNVHLYVCVQGCNVLQQTAALEKDKDKWKHP